MEETTKSQLRDYLNKLNLRHSLENLDQHFEQWQRAKTVESLRDFLKEEAKLKQDRNVAFNF